MRASQCFGAAASLAALIICVSSCATAPGAGNGRLTNADLTLISFGSVHGEHDHCG